VPGDSRQVVWRLRTRQPQVVEAIFAHVRVAVADPVGDRDAQYALGLRAAVAATVDYALAGIEHGGSGPAVLPAAAVLQAQRAARSGVTLDRVLLRYAAGSALLEDFLVEEAERSGLLTRRGALRGLLRMQAALLEQLTGAVVEEYEREHRRAVCSPAQRRVDLIKQLLCTTGSETNEFDYAFEGWHLGVLANGAHAAPTLAVVRDALGCELLSVERDEHTVWAWFGTPYPLDTAAFAQAVHGAQATADTDVSFAVGEPARGMEGWRVTHRQAQDALRVATLAPQRLTCFADVALLVPWLVDPTRARCLIETYLAPLNTGRETGRVLRQTLRSYFACEHNVNATAATLGVDRSTARRRLRAIEDALGCPLHRRRAELEVAIRLEELERTPQQPAAE
jgi:DNA-binding transcriptional ArsR family regulator